MKPIRDLMGDKRVAAALGAVAILFVGYRLVGSGKGSAPTVPAVPAAPMPAAVEEAAPAPAAPSVSSGVPIPPGWSGPPWAWDRNPFLSPDGAHSRGEDGRAAGEHAPAGGTASPVEAIPELRGTVVGRGGKGAMAIFRSDRPDGGSRLVPAGGSIGEWTLAGVEPYRVILRRGKETRVLELYKQ